MTSQRGAIPVELDRRRILFFDHAATFLLVQRYGINFTAELFTASRTGDQAARLELKSGEALHYFLWAGLQRDAHQHGETLTLDQVAEFIRPWTLRSHFSQLLLALTGSMPQPEPAPAGKSSAPEAAAASDAQPAAAATSGKKATTLKMRKGLRLHR